MRNFKARMEAVLVHRGNLYSSFNNLEFQSPMNLSADKIVPLK